jgi:hypothetical protein
MGVYFTLDVQAKLDRLAIESISGNEMKTALALTLRWLRGSFRRRGARPEAGCLIFSPSCVRLPSSL